MQTWIVFALAGSLAPADAKFTPEWHADYRLAQEMAIQQQKPLAVFVGVGPHGWTKLVRSGSPDPKSYELLARDYICLYADRSTDAGQRVAEALEIANLEALVLSDRSGKFQAFSHDGSLNGIELTRTLEKYSDPAHRVATTENISGAATQKAVIQPVQSVESQSSSVDPRLAPTTGQPVAAPRQEWHYATPSNLGTATEWRPVQTSPSVSPVVNWAPRTYSVPIRSSAPT